MSQTPTSAPGLVRVTVASGARRVDLVLPGAVPVAELVPELARNVGLLDAATVYGGYHLLGADGRRLAAESGLTLQGVEDGAFLTVAAGVDEEPPRVYDDVVEAMTDVVEHELKPWAPAAGRRTALGAAVLLLALGGVALFAQRDVDLSGIAAALVAGVLLAGAIVLSRAQDEAEVAVAVGWVAAGYGGLAGSMLSDGPGLILGERLAAVGAGVLVVGVVGLLGLDRGRILLIPAALVGALAAGVGLLVENTDAEGPVVLAVLLAVVVLLGSVFPWLALTLTGTRVDQLATAADVTADPRNVDRVQVSGDARLAHEILVAISTTVGIVLVCSAPFVVALGVSGTLLAVVCCLVVMLRTRQYRTGSEVLAGLLSGLLGLAVVALTIVALHSDWRPAAAVVLAVAGGLLLVLTMVPSGPSLRRGRLGDVVESVSLLALLPLLVLATGLFDKVTG